MGAIRVVLAISVVLAHSTSIGGVTLLGGRTAVECFFVISGFYMMLVISGKYANLGNRMWPVFMLSRVSRLYPVYAVIAIATLLAAVFKGSSTLLTQFSGLSLTGWIEVGFANITMLGQDVLVFTHVQDGTPHFATAPLGLADRGADYLVIPQAWSLSIELVFYALAPWLLRRSTQTLLLVAAGSLVVKIVLAFTLTNDPWSYRFFPAELMYFLAGALACRLIVPRLTSMRKVGPAVFVVVVAAFLLYPHTPTNNLAIVFPLAFAFAVPVLFTWTKRNPIDRWIGDLSYPMYLVHMLVYSVLIFGHITVSGAVLSVAALAVAVLIVVIIDHPIERLRQRRLAVVTRNDALPAPAVP
jgi:peptidoglycan/LPS O-acetylase OafA/YrhL